MVSRPHGLVPPEPMSENTQLPWSQISSMAHWSSVEHGPPAPPPPPGVVQVPVERAQVPPLHSMLSVHCEHAPAVHTRPPEQSTVWVHGEPKPPGPPAPSAGIAAGS